MPTADTTELDRRRREPPTDGLFAPIPGKPGWVTTSDPEVFLDTAFSAKLSGRDAPPLARASDPATAHQAAEDSRPKHRGQKRTILAAYTGYGPMTAEEVSAIVGFGAWRRVAELHKEGALRDTGETRTNASGSEATVYEITP